MKILIVEDDLSLSDVLAFTLRRAKYDVITAHDGLMAIQLWQNEKPDLITLDLNLPKLDGLGVCRHIRAHDKTPIIMLSVRGGDEAVVSGLELGADDYIVKPFSPSQLVARIRAVLRRTGGQQTPGLLTILDLTLDRTRNELQRADEAPVRLTPLEAKLLEVLMLNVGQVLASESLITAVWGNEGGDKTMLKQLVYRLRSKLEPDSSQPAYIETVPGVGYAFRNEAD